MKNLLPVLIVLAGLGSSFSSGQVAFKLVFLLPCFNEFCKQAI